MSESAENPWLSRFNRSLTLEEIERRIRVPAQPLLDLANAPPEIAEGKLEESIGSLYIPTRRVCEILKKMYLIAIVYAETTYENRKAFLRTLYCSDEHSSVRPGSRKDGPVTRCITGPAGVGKSLMLGAFKKLMPDSSKIAVDENHPQFNLKSLWQIDFGPEKNAATVLGRMVDERGQRSNGIPDADIIAHCARRAYRDGICAITVDEAQWITLSAAANARATAALYAVRAVGVPVFYGANYSLCHRLLKRNSEDTNRLIIDPIVLQADTVGPEWTAYVQEIANIAPDLITDDIDGFALDLHRFTAGLRRLAKNLIAFAYREARRAGRNSITAADLHQAYQSAAYVTMRKDVEIMGRQQITGKKERQDLWCPFPLPKSEQARVSEQMAEHREKRVAEAALADSATDDERKKYGTAKKQRPRKSEGQSASKEKTQRANARTADDLLEAARRFVEEQK